MEEQNPTYIKPRIDSFEPIAKPFAIGGESEVYETVPALGQEPTFIQKMRHYLEVNGWLKSQSTEFVVKKAIHSGFYEPLLKGNIHAEISSRYEEFHERDREILQRIYGDTYVPSFYFSWHHFKDGKARVVQPKVEGLRLSSRKQQIPFHERMQTDHVFRQKIEKIVRQTYEVYVETGYYPDLSLDNLIEEEGTGEIRFIDTMSPSFYHEAFMYADNEQKRVLAGHTAGFERGEIQGKFLSHIDPYKPVEVSIPALFMKTGLTAEQSYSLYTSVSQRDSEYDLFI